MQINEFQRKLYAEKAMDLASLSLVALTFASFFAPPFKAGLASSGFALFMLFLGISYFLSKGAKP
jgi:predicted phage tail protein